MPRLGIVDLGSNTARLVVYDYRRGAWFRQVDEIRETVRLGSGLAHGGALRRDAIERALAALRLFHDYARSARVRVEVLATSAVRDATNGAAFVREAGRVGLPVRVLEGTEEAELGVLAVANSFAFTDAWVVDLGGGSVQLSRMARRRFADGAAYPLGAVRLTEAYLAHDPPTRREVTALERQVERELGDALDDVAADDLPLVGMGGSLRNLTRAVQRVSNYPLDVVHGYFLERDALEHLTTRLLRTSADGRSEVGGLRPDRADVVLAAALVYRQILRRSGRDGIWVSGQGLRDGAFYRRFLVAPHLIADVRAFSVRNLLAHYPQPMAHTSRVRRLSLALFDGLAPLHGYGDAERGILEAAAFIHDIGTVIGYHEHHRHGEYLIANAALPGFSHREHALIALLVRFHRKGTPRADRFAALLARGDRTRLLRLAACLRLAEFLERSRAGRVEGLTVAIGRRRVIVRVEASEEPWVELREAEKQAPLLQQAFGRELHFERA